MKISVKKTPDEKYLLHDDQFDRNMVVPVNVGIKNKLKTCNSASYLVSGRIVLINPTRPDRVYHPNNVRIGLGVAFPGQYHMEALEDSHLRCFHLNANFSREDYDIVEVLLKTGEAITLTQSDGVEGGAVIFGSVEESTVNDGLPENTLFDIRDGDLTLTALEPSTIAYVVNLSVSQSGS